MNYITSIQNNTMLSKRIGAVAIVMKLKYAE